MAIFTTKRHKRDKKTVRGDARTRGCSQTEQGSHSGLPPDRAGAVQRVAYRLGRGGTRGCPPTWQESHRWQPPDRAGAVRGTSLRPGKGGTGGIPPTGQPTTLTEAALQQQMVFWYRNTYCLSHHRPRCLILSIPNERKPTLIRTGLYAGGADLLIIHLTAAQSPTKDMKRAEPTNFNEGIRMRVIFVEVKTPEGKVSPKQRKFEAHIKSMSGKVEYYVIRSLEDFKKIIII